MQGKNMDLSHRLIIAVAVLGCYCQTQILRHRPRARETYPVGSSDFDITMFYLEDIHREVAGIEGKINRAVADIGVKINEATKKITGLIGEMYCLRQGEPHELENICYFFSTYEDTWRGAEQRCEKHGGFLAFIYNDVQFKFIKDTSDGRDHWIGLSAADSPGTYKWTSNGKILDPSKHANWWGTGESGKREKKDCVVSKGGDYNKLYYVDCLDKNRFICVFGAGSH